MTELAEAILALTPAPADRTDLLLGSIINVNTDTGTVNVSVGGNLLQDVRVLAAYAAPAINDIVLLVRQGQRLYALGALSTAGQTALGTVTSVSLANEQMNVLTDSGTLTAVPWLASYANPAVGDTVALIWNGATAVVAGRIYTYTAPTPPPTPVPPPKPPPPKPPPPPPPPKPPPPRPPQTGTRTFAATASRSYRSGWRTDTDDVIQGVAPGYGGANTGAWFYGTAIRSTLRGATCTGCAIYLVRTTGGTFAAQPVHLQLHTSNNRPGGNVTFYGVVRNVNVAVGQRGWFTLPAAVGQALIDNGGGLGIQNNPYLRMTGLSRAGQNGSIRINWRR